MTQRDCWAEWLARRRFGGDVEVEQSFTETLRRKRDRILDLAELKPTNVVLDVGCGEGLIGFGALERGVREVVFSDISTDLLEHCRGIARELEVLDRCRFVRAAADDLRALADASVDVVTTRAVLIYVADKQHAFREFHRVLRPMGRMSILEPINRFGMAERRCGFAGYDLDGLHDIRAKLQAVYDAIQPPDSDPMLDFDERDLLRLAEQAGFFPIRLELRAEIEPSEPRRWETFIAQSGNPRIPTLGEAIERALTPGERERLEAHLRPLVEQGRGTWRIAEAHLTGVKSPAGPRFG